jgi:tRNA modification GTPase
MRTTPGDTIVAISSAVGAGAIAIVRLSGDAAIDIADTAFRGRRRLTDCPSHTVHHGRLIDRDGREADEVLATVMRSPRSYTTEDMVEFGCHGGPMPARRVLEVCLAAGARLARPGEFTQRAFLGGRVDLVQAEAVADVVAARTPRGLAAALGQLEGGLSGELSLLRDTLLDLRAEIEALIDFPEEEVEARTVETIAGMAESIGGRVEGLLANCGLGVAVREGMSVAIVGKPNVGKSSLMNALLMRDRSIVTALPGTTRDVIEEHLNVAGVPVRLIDTAGWRAARDEPEMAGVARAKAAAAGASVSLLVVDASSEVDTGDAHVATALDPSRTLVALNKVDLGRCVRDRDLAELLGVDWDVRSRTVCVSALRGDGLGDLQERIVRLSVEAASLEEPLVVTNVRHINALRRVGGAAVRAAFLLRDGAPPELAALEASEATFALGTITGETTPEDVLERVFGRFCVGK